MTTQTNRGIRWTDAEGNEMVIPRDTWRKDVLPRALVEHWQNADLIFFDVDLGLNDGFLEDMIPFVKRLIALEGESERAIGSLAFIYTKTGRAQDAKTALERYLFSHSPSLFILFALAHAQKALGDLDRLRRTLRQGLLLNPNDPTFLDWWYRFHKETLDEAQAEKALRQMAQEQGSWLAEVWLSRDLLEKRQIEDVLTMYRRLLDAAADQGLLLQEISGHLGEAGYYQEAIDLIYPLYDPARDGPLPGLNLLHACEDVGANELGLTLAERMLAQQWPSVNAIILKLRDSFYSTPVDELRARYSRN